MKKLLLILLPLAIVCLGGCSNIKEITYPDYVGRNIECGMLYGTVIEQTGDYLYLVGTSTILGYETEEISYSGRMLSAECYIPPKDKYEELENTKEFYEAEFADTKTFACRQHVTMPIKIIHKGECVKRTEIDTDKVPMYECEIRIDEFSTYPVFCI